MNKIYSTIFHKKELQGCIMSREEQAQATPIDVNEMEFPFKIDVDALQSTHFFDKENESFFSLIKSIVFIYTPNSDRQKKIKDILNKRKELLKLKKISSLDDYAHLLFSDKSIDLILLREEHYKLCVKNAKENLKGAKVELFTNEDIRVISKSESLFHKIVVALQPNFRAKGLYTKILKTFFEKPKIRQIAAHDEAHSTPIQQIEKLTKIKNENDDDEYKSRLSEENQAVRLENQKLREDLNTLSAASIEREKSYQKLLSVKQEEIDNLNIKINLLIEEANILQANQVGLIQKRNSLIDYQRQKIQLLDHQLLTQKNSLRELQIEMEKINHTAVFPYRKYDCSNGEDLAILRKFDYFKEYRSSDQDRPDLVYLAPIRILSSTNVPQLGLYAREALHQGQVLGAYTGQTVIDFFDNRQQYLLHLDSIKIDGKKVPRAIDAKFIGNFVSRVNHSIQPNSKFIKDDDGIILLEVAKSIAADQQILINYSESYLWESPPIFLRPSDGYLADSEVYRSHAVYYAPNPMPANVVLQGMSKFIHPRPSDWVIVPTLLLTLINESQDIFIQRLDKFDSNLSLLFIESNRDIKIYDNHLQPHTTILMVACFLALNTAVSALVTLMDVNLQESYSGKTAFFYLISSQAADNLKIDLTKTLLNAGADIFLKDRENYDVIDYCLQFNGIPILVQILNNFQTTLNVANKASLSKNYGPAFYKKLFLTNKNSVNKNLLAWAISTNQETIITFSLSFFQRSYFKFSANDKLDKIHSLLSDCLKFEEYLTLLPQLLQLIGGIFEPKVQKTKIAHLEKKFFSYAKHESSSELRSKAISIFAEAKSNESLTTLPSAEKRKSDAMRDFDCKRTRLSSS